MRLAKAVSVLLLCVTLVAGAGCDGGGGATPTATPVHTGPPSGNTAHIDKDAHDGYININLGDWLEVKLWAGRHADDYHWLIIDNTNPEVLDKVSDKYIAPTSTANLIGQDIWVFEGAEPGTTRIAMEYRKYYEGGFWYGGYFNITVTVQ